MQIDGQIRKNSFKKAAVIVIVGLLLSKLTGQVREVLYGIVLQKAELTDAYVQGFLIPDFIYDLLIGGSIQAALIPTLAKSLGTESERKTWRDVGTLITFFSLLMFGAVIILELLAEPVLALISKGSNLALTVKVARRLFPQAFFMMGAALSIGILNANKLFTRTALGPAIYNSLVCLSLIILGAASEAALLNVALGISVSACIYFLWQVFWARPLLANLRFSLAFNRPGFQKLLLLALPTMFSASLAQFSNIVLQAYTKSMPLGSATALRYATTIWMLPYGIFTVAIGQVMLPSLATYIGQANYHKTGEMLNKALRLVLLFALPSALIFFAMREEIVIGIFWWKNYQPTLASGDLANFYKVLQATASILAFYCPVIVCQSIIYIYNYAYYAHSITLVPLVNAFISLILTCAFGYVAANSGKVQALSLAFLLSSLFMAYLLQKLYHRKFKQEKLRNFAYFIWQNWVALMALSIYLVVDYYYLAPQMFSLKIYNLLYLGMRGLLAYFVYYLFAYLLGVKELRNIKQLLH